ncbi:hypothetical protein GCM10025865_07190 [Paraoerskovia sediminicola]|uniref:NAD-dependent epimerase/dehydratase domain-containing protein n=1 Tax=Paraoerskovia sediminicola TaxID=1138587 RepID=A0ABN6X9T2_9CELL|nr:hypothetical protein GCM10025865_07190 [Paraoerskovia sediminicola]
MASMNPQSILFVGGSGIISAASVTRAVEAGHRVTVLNRGASTTRPLPAEVETLRADAEDSASVDAALGSREFDVVAQFRAFSPVTSPRTSRASPAGSVSTCSSARRRRTRSRRRACP